MPNGERLENWQMYLLADCFRHQVDSCKLPHGIAVIDSILGC